MNKIEENSLSKIALKKSINFDMGQTYISKFFDNLLGKLNNFETKSFITRILIKNNTTDIRGLYLYRGVGLSLIHI